MNKERVAFAELPGICICLIAVLLAQANSLPIWVFGLVIICVGLRLALGWRGREAPPRGAMIAIALISIALLFLRFRTFNGLAAGTALLALTAGLKVLETRTRRDIYIVTLVIFFLALSALLLSESFWLLAYLLLVAWFASIVLLRVTTLAPAPRWGQSLRYGVRLALQAVPLAMIFWFLFPRFAAPLWHLPGSSGAATTGLSDSMSPGDITSLAQSDEIAFRVHFATAAPAPKDQYWRGPVLHDFDGRSWSRRTFQPNFSGPPPPSRGQAYRYTINLEPHDHNWVYALDWPAQFALERGTLTVDYTVSQPFPVDRPIDVKMTSFALLPENQVLSSTERTRDTFLPRGNPRSVALAKQMRVSHPDEMDMVLAVLDMFAKQEFFYTLTPPPLGEDSVDDFLFSTRRGFCGHYASAFALLMRAAKIPTRVVTGYQGGTFNRFANYWIVRQREAHAWDEVWINGHGWMRIDPTASISPSRVLESVNDSVAVDEPLTSHWQSNSRWFRDAALRLDQLSELWREQILTFNQDSQERLLRALHIPEPDGQKLVLVLAAMMSVVLLWLTWQVRRELEPSPKDPTLKAYARLCAKLAAVGFTRRPDEGSEDYAQRIAAQRPDLAEEVSGLCDWYAALRYAAPSDQITLRQFQEGVRAFRPSKKPPAPSGG
jgi:protein-glutamine gamma-glutamyltransferase